MTYFFKGWQHPVFILELLVCLETSHRLLSFVRQALDIAYALRASFDLEAAHISCYIFVKAFLLSHSWL